MCCLLLKNKKKFLARLDVTGLLCCEEKETNVVFVYPVD